MSNTLDTVLVKYRGKNEEDKEKEPVTVPEFLKIPAKQLTDMEYRVQKALAFIYEQNGKEPPLFWGFENWRPEEPLTIDCLNLPKKQSKTTIAWYSPGQNLIGFEQTWKKVDLINTISHELKHAEQYSKECDALNEQYKQENNRAKVQKLRLIKETQSQIFGVYVSMLQCKGQKVPKRILKDMRSSFYKGVDKDGVHFPGVKDLLEEQPDVTKWNYQEIEKRLLPASYMSLLKSSYKKDYDCDIPIKKSDLQDQNIHIPNSFHITGPTDFISDFSYEKVKTPFGRLMQLVANPSDTLTDEDIELIESEDKKKYGKYLLNTPDEKKKRKEYRSYHFDINDYNAEARISIYLDYLWSHGREDRVFELLNRSDLLTWEEKQRFLYHYNNELAMKLYKEKRPYQPEHMKLLEMKDKKGKWFLDSYAQEQYLSYLYEEGQEAYAWDLLKNGSMDSEAKGEFIYKYIEKKNEENGEIPPEQMTLIESKDKKGKYLLKEYSGHPTSEYTKYLLSHGLENYAIRLFKQHKCDDTWFVHAYLRTKDKENRPFLPEEMALIETKNKDGAFVSQEYIRREYLDHLWSHGQEEHVFELLKEKAFWEYEEGYSPRIENIDRKLYLSAFLNKKCQEGRPFARTEMKLFEGKQIKHFDKEYVLDNEDRELYINYLVTHNPKQWPYAADLIFNKKFFDLYEDEQSYWRKQVFLSKYLDHKIDENKPLTKEEMQFFEIKLKNMEPASFNERYSEKDNFEANFKDDYFMHPMLRQKYVQFLIDHGQEKKACQLLEDSFDQKGYYFNKIQPNDVNAAAMKTQGVNNVAAMNAPNDNTDALKTDGNIETPKGPDINIAAMKAIKDKHNQL